MLSKIINVFPIPACITDSESNVVACNEAWLLLARPNSANLPEKLSRQVEWVSEFDGSNSQQTTPLAITTINAFHLQCLGTRKARIRNSDATSPVITGRCYEIVSQDAAPSAQQSSHSRLWIWDSVPVSDSPESQQPCWQTEALTQRRKLQTILDTVPASIFVKDADHRYRRVNREMTRLLGLTADQIIGHTDQELGLTRSQNPSAAEITVMRHGIQVNGSVEAVETASGLRWLQINRLPSYENESIVGVIGLAVDVTDRIHAEQAVRQSESRLIEAQEIGNMGSFHWDACTDRVSWSESLVRIFGLNEDEVPKDFASYLNLIHPEDRQLVASRLSESMRAGTPFDHIYRITRRNGDTRWLRARGRIIHGHDKKVVAVSGTCQDVSEQRLIEDALRVSDERHRALLNAVPDAVIIHSNGSVRFCNSAAQILIRAEKPSHVVGLPLDSLIRSRAPLPDFDVQQDRNRWVLNLQNNRVSNDIVLHCLDGTTKPVEITASGLVFQGEQVTLISIHDLTERRRIEAELRHAQKLEAVGRLAGGIAHDFNNLLTVIMGYSELLLTSLPPSDPSAKLIAEISKAGNRATQLTRQLLTFSRRQNFEPIETDINWCLVSTLPVLERMLGENVRITTDLYPEPLRIRIDPLQFEQVVINLCLNSQDAMPKGGRILLRTMPPDVGSVDNTQDTRLFARLQICDSGSGIPAGIRDRVFDPFFTTKEAGHGIGLGLSVVHGIVEEAGGDISIESSSIEGTTVTVHLPLAPQSTVAHSLPESFRARPNETILIVEDDDSVRDLAVISLRTCGYNVLAARNGQEALDAIHNNATVLSLVATDVVLPDIGADAITQAIRARAPGIRILLMSGYTEDAVSLYGIDATEAAFIQKPFTPESFCHIVRAILDNRDDTDL
ncbi:MAG: PAS domain S-box protein [Planctomycetaceae bacterium]|nr:PAS domain S-box protein [Planctomycetaceae bacterium]